jgi:hypothetical protein
MTQGPLTVQWITPHPHGLLGVWGANAQLILVTTTNADTESFTVTLYLKAADSAVHSMQSTAQRLPDTPNDPTLIPFWSWDSVVSIGVKENSAEITFPGREANQ